MMNFTSIQRDQTIKKLNGLVQRSTKQCVICHLDINLNGNRYYYDCNRHEVHRNCLADYKRSKHHLERKWACPMRCPYPEAGVV